MMHVGTTKKAFVEM